MKAFEFLGDFLRLSLSRGKARRFLAGLGAAAIVFLVYLFWSSPDGRLHLYFFDVGQGDSLLVLTPEGRKILIDGGPDEKVLDCLGRVLPFYDRRLDLVVLTHPHADHVTGLIEVIRRYQIDQLLANKTDYQTPETEEFWRAVEEKGIEVRSLTTGGLVDLGEVKLECFWPPAERVGMESSSPNLDSIVLRLRNGRFNALLTGDAEGVVQQQLILLDRVPLPVAVLKVPHQGAEGGCDREFIKRIKPELAIISVGWNQFGHPSEKTLDLLKNLEIEVLRTDKEGTIEILSDGEKWSLGQGKKGFYEKD